ncbi:MAG: SGNH/GDSL hydrolase family protein [Syntrophobacteraceae bacterium]
MMRRRFFRLGSLLAVLTLAVCAAAPSAWAKHSLEVYVIGDSLSDPGNMYDLTGGVFPLSPPYDQRFSNGPVWAEYFAEQLGVKLDDRAYGGAFTGKIVLPVKEEETVKLFKFSNYNSYQYWGILPRTLPGVKEEVAGLLADHPKGLNPKALYVVWAGANDFFAALENPTLLDSILSTAVKNIACTIGRLSAAGARHFAVANLPDIGLTPFGQSYGPFAAEITKLVVRFNAALEAKLAALPRRCAQTLVVLDAFEIMQEVVPEVIENPGAYGFVNAVTPCIALGLGADCSQHLFWDPVHPTTAGHALFAERFRAAFCGTGDRHPGLRGRPDNRPPPEWRGICYGSK